MSQSADPVADQLGSLLENKSFDLELKSCVLKRAKGSGASGFTAVKKDDLANSAALPSATLCS